MRSRAASTILYRTVENSLVLPGTFVGYSLGPSISKEILGRLFARIKWSRCLVRSKIFVARPDNMRS